MANKNHLFTRREFIKSMAVASAGVVMPSFLGESLGKVMAQDSKQNPIPGFKDDHVLVVVQLGGGNDGLNMVVPHGDDHYYRKRPNIAIPRKKVHSVNNYLGFHPQMKGLRKLYDRGKVGLINGVGYPNPSRSHFRSMKIWQTASDSDRIKRNGWIGRYFDNCCDGKPDPGAVAGVAIGDERPRAFQGTTRIGVAMENPRKFQLKEGKGINSENVIKKFNRPTGNGDGDDSTLDFLRHTTADMITTSKKIQRASRKKRNQPNYPDNRFANDLKKVANLIVAEVPTRIFYVSLGGFDTHKNQAGRHANLCRRFSEGLTAFYNDLEMNNQSRRVLMLTFSEFGRRVAENGSNGTDHGTAGPMFLIGDAVKPGIHSRHPSLDQLVQGDLKIHVDFRSVYATVLSDWFNVDHESVLGRKYPTGDLIQT